MNGHLVIGGSGQIGHHLFNVLKTAENVYGTYLNHPEDHLIHLDINSYANTKKVLCELKPAVVYCPAYISNVDYCEQNPEETYLTNGLGLWNVIKIATEIGARLVYFSSDYIFDGKNGPYREDDLPNPICVYGHQKLIGEHAIMRSTDDYLIVRSTVIYSWESQGKNFIYRLLNSLEKGLRIQVPTDQIGNPTYGPDLAQAVIDLVEDQAVGIFNITGQDRLNRYEFAVEVAKTFDMDPNLILPVTTDQLKQAARRPLNAGLISDKAAERLQRKFMGYKEGLERMVVEKLS